MMSEIVTCEDEVPITDKLSAKPKRASTGALLFNTVAFSFLAGMSFMDGIRHVRTARNEYEWTRDFLMSAAWLLIALVSGLRKFKEDKT